MVNHFTIDMIILPLLIPKTVVITVIKGRHDLATLLAKSSTIVLESPGNSINISNAVVMFPLFVVHKEDIHTTSNKFRREDLVQEGVVEFVDIDVDVQSCCKLLKISFVCSFDTPE